MTPDIVALLIVLLALGMIVVLIAHKGKPRINKAHFQSAWEKIEALENYHMAVMKADALVDEALKAARIKGGTMGERLNNAAGFLRDINGAWVAHKLRNKIAHEPDADPTAMECQRALRQFKKALKDLGAL